MKLYVFVFIATLAMTTPSEALLGAKLALFGILKNNFGGGGDTGSYGNGGGYAGGYSRGYSGGYSGGYGNGGFLNYNRPVYTGQSSNYGWGQQSYGGGYRSGFNGGSSSGYNGEEPVRVIKVIVNREQPQLHYDNFGKSSASSASAVSSSSGISWSSIPQPAQTVQVSAPSTVAVPAPAPVQVIQPQPQYISRPQPVYQHVAVQKPILYQPFQSTWKQSPLPYQQPQVQHTIKLIVDGESQHVPAQTYGPPQPSTTFIAPNVDSAGAYNFNYVSRSNSENGPINVSTGPLKNGGIWESIGC